MSIILSIDKPVIKPLAMQLPVQSLKRTGSTHVFCIEQAIKILHNDNYIKAAGFFNYFFGELEEGVTWADKGIKSIYHHFDIVTGLGIWHYFSAAQMYEYYLNRALGLWKKKKHAKAMFYLGAASHLVQDMCVPHHARCLVGNGHFKFERWAKANRENYSVDDRGIYRQEALPGDWIRLNAAFSRNYLPYVQANSSKESYHHATGILLPRAQRTTGGFLLWFYRLISNTLYAP